jgi:hypothetical protein
MLGALSPGLKWPGREADDSSPTSAKVKKIWIYNNNSNVGNMRWAGHVARMGAKRNTYRLLVGKLDGNRPLGRPRHRWVDNIRMDFGEVGWGDVD